MIEYHYEHDFELDTASDYTDWITRIIRDQELLLGPLSFVYCSDKDLLQINQTYLNHDFYTDVITFDYSTGKEVSGDIMISIDRVKDNAERLGVTLEEELKRVMIHGVMHLMGHSDATEEERLRMRELETNFIKMFHVEQ